MCATPKRLFIWRPVTMVTAAMLTLISVTSAVAQQNNAPEALARALLSRMTLDDKVNMMHGELNNFFGFYNAPIVPLGIPALKMADGPGEFASGIQT